MTTLEGLTPRLDGLTPGAWKIDTSHSTAEFTVRHLMVTKVRGRFTDITGTITIAESPLKSSVDVAIGTGSVTTGDEARDVHLRSNDFLDVETFPAITFVSTKVEGSGPDYKLTGDLTLHGVTKPVELALEFNGVSADPWGGTRAGFSAETEINRRDFGVDLSMPLDGGGVVVGDKVKIQIEVEAIKS